MQEMSLMKMLQKPLQASEIDFRIQSISKTGMAVFIPYKDARADMKRLDEVVWPLNWKREHKIIGHSLYCIVSIYDEKKQQWVSKEDIGTESNTEKEKWESSDSFKRACFNWGIGRELYEYPNIFIQLNPDEFEEIQGKIKQTYKLKLKKWKWASKFNQENKIVSLAAKDEKDILRFKIWDF